MTVLESVRDWATAISTVVAAGLAHLAIKHAKAAQGEASRLLRDERRRDFELGLLRDMSDA
jgi:hypothetical protein